MLHNHKPFDEFKKFKILNSRSSELKHSTSREALNAKTRRHGFTIRRRFWEFLTEQSGKMAKTSKRFMWRVAYKSRRRMRRARQALAERRRNHQERRRKSTPLANPSSVLALEPRIVFDAAAAATVDQTAYQVAEQQADDAADNRASDSPSNDNEASSDDFASVTVTESGGREIAFVDGSLEDIDQLLSEIDPSVEIIMLDVNQDGVEQIAAALQGRNDIDAIHILSHGSPGQLSLGTGTLTSETIQGEYADELAIVRDPLADTGDILIYGCDFTAGTLGQEAAQLLSDVTGADIAASDDDTGHDSLGGDWDLETQIGVINVESIQAVNWEQLMAPLVVTQVDGTTTTATTLANNIAGTGVTVTGVTFAGANNQAGTFTGATGFANEWLGFDSGVVLSTGDVNNTGGAPAGGSSTVIGSAGDADLQAIANATSFDASVLEIDFIPTASVITLQFTFGSEEYNEYVYSNFNDAIGVWVNGVHSSITPTGDALAIDSVNQAGTFNPLFGILANDPNPTNGVYDSANPSLYVNNSTGAYNVEMDGFSVTLTFTATVNIGVTNTIKLGVSDIGDGAFDSWLFIAEDSLQTNTLAHTDFASTNINTAVTIDALANDTDAESDPLSITHITDQPITAGGAAVTLATGATVQLTLTGELIYTPATGQTGIENFTYTIADGTGSTAVGYISVNIGTNTAPVVDLNDDGTSAARDFSTSFTEGGAAVSVTANNAGVIDSTDVSFPELDITLGGFLSSGNEVLSIGGTDFTFGTAQISIVHIAGLSANVVYNGANGFTVTNAAPGTEMSEADLELLIQSITYDHAGASATSGARTLSFQASDGDLLSNVAVSTINVTGTNDNPVAVDDAFATDEDTTSSAINLVGNDTDVDGDTLSVQSIAGTTLTPGTAQTIAVTNGTVNVSIAGVITFTPDTNYNGAIAFDYVVSDGNGGTNTGTVNGTINAINDDPDAVDDSYSTDEDTALVIPAAGVLGNDSDIDGDTITVLSNTAASNGSVTVNGDGSFTYTPNANFNGSDSFTYTISDGNGGSDTATVTLTVTSVNDNPVAVDDAFATDEDTTSAAINLITNDTDVDGDTLSVQSIAGTTLTPGTAQTIAVTNGTVNVSIAGVITFTPDTNYNGAITFDYVVSDGNGGTVNGTINAINDDPDAVDDSYSTDEDTALVIPASGVLGNDSDIDGDTITVLSNTAASNGSVNGDGSFTYTPNANFNGSDSFTYTISDGNGGSDTATVTITVTPVNDAPVVNPDTATTPEDTPVTIDVLANDSDPDGEPLTVTQINGTPITIGGPGVPVTGGIVTLNPTGTVTFTPTPDFNGTPSFTYTAEDPSGTQATSTVSLTVQTPDDSQVNIEDFDVFLPPENDPVAGPKTSALDDMDVNDIVVNTVESFGQIQSSSLGPGVDGIVVDAVNNIDRLGGMRSPGSGEGSISTTIRDIELLRALANEADRIFGRTTFDSDIQSWMGYSLRLDVGGLTQLGNGDTGGQIVVETLVRKNILYIQITNTLDTTEKSGISGYKIMQADGTSTVRSVTIQTETGEVQIYDAETKDHAVNFNQQLQNAENRDVADLRDVNDFLAGNKADPTKTAAE